MRALVVTSESSTLERRSPPPTVARQAGDLRALGIDVDVIDLVGATDPRAYLRARPHVRSTISHERYDVIHVEHGHCALPVLGLGVPIVLTAHESDLIAPTDTQLIRRTVFPAINRWAAKRADAVIVPSHRAARALPEGVQPHIIDWGVDLEVFRPGDRAAARATLSLPLDRPVVVFSCSPYFSPFGRYERAVEAVAALRPKDPLLVTLPDDTDARTIAAVLVASDVVLVTFPHWGWEIRSRQALACRRPVVHAGVPATGEWIEHVSGSVFIDDDSPSGIAAAIADALAEPVVTLKSSDASQIDQRSSAVSVRDVYRSLI